MQDCIITKPYSTTPDYCRIIFTLLKKIDKANRQIPDLQPYMGNTDTYNCSIKGGNVT